MSDQTENNVHPDMMPVEDVATRTFRASPPTLLNTEERARLIAVMQEGRQAAEIERIRQMLQEYQESARIRAEARITPSDAFEPIWVPYSQEQAQSDPSAIFEQMQPYQRAIVDAALASKESLPSGGRDEGMTLEFGKNIADIDYDMLVVFYDGEFSKSGQAICSSLDVQNLLRANPILNDGARAARQGGTKLVSYEIAGKRIFLVQRIAVDGIMGIPANQIQKRYRRFYGSRQLRATMCQPNAPILANRAYIIASRIAANSTRNKIAILSPCRPHDSCNLTVFHAQLLDSIRRVAITHNPQITLHGAEWERDLFQIPV